MKTILRKDQSGVAAIEFSLVFALLFATFWAIISYALPLYLYPTMNQAVADTPRDLV
jgi:Flp pilus assembly protein TadG